MIKPKVAIELEQRIKDTPELRILFGDLGIDLDKPMTLAEADELFGQLTKELSSSKDPAIYGRQLEVQLRRESTEYQLPRNVSPHLTKMIELNEMYQIGVNPQILVVMAYKFSSAGSHAETWKNRNTDKEWALTTEIDCITQMSMNDRVLLADVLEGLIHFDKVTYPMYVRALSDAAVTDIMAMSGLHWHDARTYHDFLSTYAEVAGNDNG